mgnify:CR=1 FL=1
MKKLLWFLLPIGAWIGTGFLWSYSEQFLDADVGGWGFWWITTDILMVPIDIFLLVIAVALSGLVDD